MAIASNLFLCPLPFFLFFLFLLEKFCGKHQCPHPQNQGIHKIKNSADKRNLSNHFRNYTFILLYADLNLLIGLSYCYGITIPAFHHNPFQDRLPSYIR